MMVIADAVLNHCDKGDAEETNPISGNKAFTLFNPASGKFKRNWTNFHPCEYDSADTGAFYGDLEGYFLPDLCHDNPYTYLEVMNYVRWLRDKNNGIGYDAFRYDAVKYFDSWIVQSIQEWQKTFGIVEYWDGNKNAIKEYLDYIKWSASAFDFPLFYTLREMCNNYSFDMRQIWGNGLVFNYPMNSVSFVSNHDVERTQPIITDKLMAYAYTLTHEGAASIFWQDFYNFGLALSGTPNGIEKLCQVNKNYAGGTTNLLYVDQNLYIAQRNGWESKPGLIVAINNNSSAWQGTWVQTKWQNRKMVCSAWWGHEMGKPMDKWTNGGGWGEFYAPPRGYAVYIPEAV
jgi:alpha-amylase